MQRLHNKFLKNSNKKDVTEYRNYQNLFEAVEKRYMKRLSSKLILTVKNIIQNSIGKGK